MKQQWHKAHALLANFTIQSHPNNKPVTIEGSSNELRCIGVGTDAAVFQLIEHPHFAFKKFAADKVYKIKEEARVYEILGTSPYFSTCYEVQADYLVLSYESGITLYDCLLQGIRIPAHIFEEVECAKEYARSQGLNPRDIHLKNVFLQDGHAKIVDVSEYGLPGDDCRWEHLQRAYDEYYYLIEGKALPHWLMETVRKWYNQRQPKVIDDFIREVVRLKFFIK